MSNFYADEDESGEFISPLFPKPHKVPPFDPSPARADDIALISEALKLQPGREKMGLGAARQIVALQRDRERRAEAAKKAKASYARRQAAVEPLDARSLSGAPFNLSTKRKDR